jgi:hypothetical protein
MPEAHGVARTYDLSLTLPAPWRLAGFSQAQSDGVNLYRTPTQDQISLTFLSPVRQFVQYSDQLFSPRQGVTAELLLNGQVQKQSALSASQYQDRTISGFTQIGENVLLGRFICRTSCDWSAIRHYKAQLTLAPVRTSVTAVGLGVERWWLDAPDSPLRVEGTGPLRYDNVNFLRYLTGSEVRLSWPPGSRVIDADVQVAADQPFKTTFLIADKVIERAQGNASTTVAPTLSLVSMPGATALTMKVECLTTPDLPCARIYFTRVSAVPSALAAPPSTVQLLMGFTLLALALGLLWRLLRLPGSQARMGQGD